MIISSTSPFLFQVAPHLQVEAVSRGLPVYATNLNVTSILTNLMEVNIHSSIGQRFFSTHVVKALLNLLFVRSLV